MKIFHNAKVGAAMLMVFISQSAAQWSPDQVKRRMEGVLQQLPAKLSADSTGRTAQDYVNRERLIINTIQPFFYSTPGDLHQSSPARERMVTQVESWLVPFQDTLLAVAVASASSGEAPNAVMSLLAFAKPTNEVRSALLSIARDPESDPQKASEAYDAVFMLELDDATIRREVLDKIGWRDERHTRADLAANLLTAGSSRWGMVELQDLYREFLSLPFKPENYPQRGGRGKLTSQYDIAIRGLKAFGIQGESFGDLLRARLAEMDPSQDTDLMNSCRETMLMIEGKCNPMPVVTWKGHFMGVSKQSYPAWAAGNKPARRISPDPGSSSHSLGSTDAARVDNQEAKPADADTRSQENWWAILLTAGLSTVVATWLLLNKRKTGIRKFKSARK